MTIEIKISSYVLKNTQKFTFGFVAFLFSLSVYDCIHSITWPTSYIMHFGETDVIWNIQ